MKKLAVTVLVILLAVMVGTVMVSAQDNMGGAMAPQGAMGKGEVNAKLQQMSKALQLSPEQQEKIKPILMEEAPKLQAIKSDTSLTPAQKMMQMKQVREATDSKLQPILSPEQQQKLQEMRAQQAEQMMQKKRELQ